MNGDDSHNSRTGVRRQAPLSRECTYSDFMKCKPLYFNGTEGVVNLTQWFERMETVFCISIRIMENQIKFATCTLFVSALTWWNSHVRNVGHDVAYAMTCTNLKKKITDKYCPMGEIKKVEVEMCNMKVKGTDPRVGHLTQDCSSLTNTNYQRNLTCYECGNQGHYSSDCLELKNQNHESQAGGTGARGMVHALGGGETNQDLNDIEDDINA
nr:hypothetical protein [Tanacetum cinerariifolium]